MCKKSKTDTDDPIRDIDLTASAAPIIAKSRTDREKTEPSRLKPSKETEEPQREQLRNDIVEARLKKSIMDMEATMRKKDRTERDDPR